MRRLKTTGSIYRRGSDNRWMGAVSTGVADRKRRTVSSALFCTTLKRMEELDAIHHGSIERRDRALNMEAARRLGTHTQRQWWDYVKANGRICEYCDWPCRPTKDHRTPVSRGGSDGIENLAVACFRCNNAKNNATEEEYRLEIRLRGGIGPGHNKRWRRRAA